MKITAVDVWVVEGWGETMWGQPVAALAAIDVACWDAIGKITGQPVGEPPRRPGMRAGPDHRVDHSYLRGWRVVGSGSRSPCGTHHEDRGVGWFHRGQAEGHCGCFGDVAILQAIRAALPKINLRVDPNADR